MGHPELLIRCSTTPTRASDAVNEPSTATNESMKNILTELNISFSIFYAVLLANLIFASGRLIMSLINISETHATPDAVLNLEWRILLKIDLSDEIITILTVFFGAYSVQVKRLSLFNKLLVIIMGLGVLKFFLYACYLSLLDERVDKSTSLNIIWVYSLLIADTCLFAGLLLICLHVKTLLTDHSNDYEDPHSNIIIMHRESYENNDIELQNLTHRPLLQH